MASNANIILLPLATRPSRRLTAVLVFMTVTVLLS